MSSVYVLSGTFYVLFGCAFFSCATTTVNNAYDYINYYCTYWRMPEETGSATTTDLLTPTIHHEDKGSSWIFFLLLTSAEPEFDALRLESHENLKNILLVLQLRATYVDGTIRD